MEYVDRYRNEMMRHLPEKNDDLLLIQHRRAVEMVMENMDEACLSTEIAFLFIEAFMDIIDLNWSKRKELCRNTLDRWDKLEIGTLPAETFMQIVGLRLEHLDRRQDADFKVLLQEQRKPANAVVRDNAFVTTDLLRANKERMKDRLQDTEFGILEKLLASGSLTYQETSAIQNCSTDPYVKNDRLIEEVLKKNIVPGFIRALEHTNQKHLVNYLRGDGVHREEFGDEWPLTEDLIKILDENREALIDIIDPNHNGLIDSLLSAKVITQRQRTFISEKPDTLTKNTALLNVLRRLSVKGYKSTVNCLEKSNQKHVAEILSRGGVVIKVRFSQEGEPHTVNRIEDELSNKIVDILRGRTIEEIQRTFEVTQFKIYSAKKGESIYLYVYCATLKELRELHRLLVNGTVRTNVETLFNKLASVEDRIIVTLKYSEDEYDKCKLYFRDRLLHSIAGGTDKNFEMELKLRMTWGRATIFFNYWIDCRKETIDIFNNILDVFRGVEVSADEANPARVLFERIDNFDNLTLKFAQVVNKDLSCYMILLTKLTEFLYLVTSSEYTNTFGTVPTDLFYNVSTYQTSISERQWKTSHGLEICETIVNRDENGLGEMSKLLACTSRPLLHLKDLLRKLSEEGKLNHAGIKGVMNDLQQEEAAMSAMFSESLLSFIEVSSKVIDAAEQLKQVMKKWLPKRVESIRKIKEIIQKLNKTTETVATVRTVSSNVGIVGGAIAIGGLILAPFTFGATLIPSAIAGGVSGLGAATAIGAGVAGILIDEGEMEKAKLCIEEDKVLFEEVAKAMDNLKKIASMLTRYIPQDELDNTVKQATSRMKGADGKAIVIPVSAAVVAGIVLASKAAIVHSFQGTFILGTIMYIFNLVLASVKLGNSGKSECAEKLEEVVKKMEEEKTVLENCL